MKKLILSTIALLIILITSCDSPTEVIDDSQPGRRDYVWTVDTIKVDASGYLTPLRIWGSSPKNIWLTCSSDRPKYNLWHYVSEHLNALLFPENDDYILYIFPFCTLMGFLQIHANNHVTYMK